MAEVINIEHLKPLIECSLCLEKFDNPRHLRCNHQFCKECLEGIIQFRDDGSGTVTCPMRCSVETVIGVDETINDLPLSYEFKGILEVLKIGNERSLHAIPKCTNCAKFISTYCCESMMCSTCFANHKNTKSCHQHRRTTNLSFNRRENKFNILCEEHCSKCTHLCSDGKFLCMYCLIRNEEHKNHKKNTIEHDVKLIKETLTNEANIKEKILLYRQATEENIKISKRKFDNLLEIRKEECVSRYIEFLNNEKEILKRKFDNICDNNLNQYPHYLANYSQETLEKRDVAIAIEKDEIFHTISKNINKLTLIHETVALSKNFNFLSDHPLGDIEVTLSEEISINSPPMSTLRDDSKEEQKNIIIDGTRAALHIGDPWYLLDIHWFKKWKKYIDSICAGRANDPGHPGPIDNSPLFQMGGTKLKEHLLEGSDYKLINEWGWKHAVRWYGVIRNQQPIKRNVVGPGIFNREFRVEVYLIRLQLCSSTDFERVLVKEYSKSTTVRNVVKEMETTFGIFGQKTRVWNKFMTNTFEIITKMDLTLQESGIGSGQMLVLESRNEDGEWPSSSKTRTR